MENKLEFKETRKYLSKLLLTILSNEKNFCSLETDVKKLDKYENLPIAFFGSYFIVS